MDLYTQDEDNYQAMLSDLSKRYKVEGSDIEGLMDKVGWHESKNVSDAIQQSGMGTYEDGSTQYGEGPGRGLFQFETKKSGGSGAGQTALNRLRNYFNKKGIDAPDWVNSSYEDFDASQLSPTQQKMLFMANQRMSEDGGFYADEIANPAEWSAKYHFRGSDENKKGYIDRFNRDLESY